MASGDRLGEAVHRPVPDRNVVSRCGLTNHIPSKGKWSCPRLSHRCVVNGIRSLGKLHDVGTSRGEFRAGDRLQHVFDSAPETFVFRRVLIEGEKGVDQESAALTMIAHGKKVTHTDKCLANEPSAI